ncbi:MAG: alpha/beta hydrolase [Erysipelotrichaceae bacterium]|nr:alpha/beta hydrolase [Erysipelotrichaceae bacterium]
MKNSTKIAALVVGSAAATYVSYKAISESLFNKVFKAQRSVGKIDDEYREWFTNSKVTKVSIKSFDGLKLYAYKIVNHEDAPFMLMVHGISNNKENMFSRAVEFDKLGYNLLLIDLRACGESEGEYITYGQKESIDILLWCRYLKIKHPNAPVVLYGTSLGAASVMMASSLGLDKNVKCIVEDCGYSSLYEELDYVIRHDYKLNNTKIILNIFNGMMKEKFGITFDDVSPKMSLENNEIPIVFVHGEADELVPFTMATILYNHNKGIKKYYPVADAGHAKSFKNENYFVNIDNFIRNYI